MVTLNCARPVDLKKEEALYDAHIKALPELKVVPTGQQLILKVHYVERAGLPGLDTNIRDDLYRLTEDLARKALGYNLKFEETIVYRAPEFVKAMRKRLNTSPTRYPALAYQISWLAPDRDQRVLEAIRSALKDQPAERLAQYLGKDVSPEAASRVFLDKLGRIYTENDFSGKPLLSEKNAADEVLFSYGHWSTILQTEREADFIVTNTGIIGADSGMPLYVIARGGVTSAFIENNAHRPYQGAGVIGLYPFLSDLAFFNAERGMLTLEQKLEAIAWVWVHELGHLLLKKEENYTFADSVHRAAPDLRYYEWVKKIRDSKSHHSDKIGVMKKF